MFRVDCVYDHMISRTQHNGVRSTSFSAAFHPSTTAVLFGERATGSTLFYFSIEKTAPLIYATAAVYTPAGGKLLMAVVDKDLPYALRVPTYECMGCVGKG